MSATWKTVRVFISSTFRDMQAERDHLVRFVFPRLREELLARRIHLVDVDLRWGVTSDQDASEVCREVVDECHPRFLCILGGRYGWVPEGKSRSITAAEIHYGVLDREAAKRGFAFFYFRDDSATAAMVETKSGEFREPQDSDNQIALDELKQAIAAAGLNPFIYPAQWDEQSRRLIGLTKFGERVHHDLLRSMKDDPELRDRFTEPAEKLDEFMEENAAMEAFIAERTERFVLGSRKLVMDELRAHANGNGGNGYLCLVGEPGSGKSALLAHFSQHLTLNNQTSTLLISHFIGASTGSTDVRRTLRRLCYELIAGSGITAEIPEDPEKLRMAFPEILKQASAKKRVVILLDAVNQFDSTSQLAGLRWLPEELPDNGRIILSTLPGPMLGDLQRRRNPPHGVPLPALTQTDGETIIKEFLHRYRKTMTDAQLAKLLAKTDAVTPLYLLAALEELRTLGTYEEITDCIAQLPSETQALFTWILKRLEDDDGFRDGSGRKIGTKLVPRFASLMGVSRHGLSQRELMELLAPGDSKAAIPNDAQGNVAALVQLLRPYLMRRGELLDFYHGQFREAVENKFLKTDEQSQISHKYLADYFVGCAKGSDMQKEWETDKERGFSECVFHFTMGKDYAEAYKLLSNFPFLLHKARNGLLEGILTDYPFFESNVPKEFTQSLQLWCAFFRERAHILRRGNHEWPTHKILLQLAVEHADDSLLTMAAEQWLAEGRCDWLWLRRVPRLTHIQKNPCLAVLEGHTSIIDGALVLADGRLLSWSYDGTLSLWDGHSGKCLAVLEGHADWVLGALELADGRLLSWSGDGLLSYKDNTLRLWDGHNGTCLAVLEGHTESVRGALELADGSLLSWAKDKTLRLWDNHSGKCLAVLEEHTHDVLGVQALADGRLLSWAKDKTLRLWDSHSGRCLAVLEGHTHDVLGVLALADGRLLSWSRDKTLRLWDGHSGACLAVLEGHSSGVYGALTLADGRLFSWSMDGTLRLWNGKSGACLAVLEGHTILVDGALALADGRLLSWSMDKTLRLWDSHSGRCLAVLEGHTHDVLGALALADGRLLSWSRDKTLRLWDDHSGACLAVFEGHTDAVWGALALADGRLLSWSYDGTLRLWDGHNSACLTLLEGHIDWIRDALSLADGRLLSWSRDKTLRLWDGHSGACLAVLEGHTKEVSGALALADGRLLSWSGDKTLRLWDGHSGMCLAVLEGHTKEVSGALALTDGRLLSWSDDRTLRLWDGHNSACLMLLEGHIDWIRDALSLADGRLLSWSRDKTLRLWDGHSGACLAVLEGHTKEVSGALALADGRLLSWSDDRTLRLWDSNSGACLAILEGHNSGVGGALALTDGRLLSWSGDKTLRLWDGHSGTCLAVLEGHSSLVSDALTLTDGRLLSWSYDNTLRLWDGHSGICLEVVASDQVGKRHAEWHYALAKARNRDIVVGDFFSVVGDFFAAGSTRAAHLRNKAFPSNLAVWNADSDSKVPCLLPDGTTVVTQANGQVCILKLQHGNRHVSLTEVEEIIAPQMKK